MERYFIAPDDILDENGGLAFHKGQRVQVDESSPMFTAEALERQGLVDEQKMPAREPSATDAINTLVDETAQGNLGELFQDPTGEDSTPVHILKSAGKGLVSSVAHGAAGVEKGFVGGVLDTVSAGARVLGGDKLADQLQDLKRSNDALVDKGTGALDDALLGEDPGRAAWDAMMGVSEGLGGIYGGIKAAAPLAAWLKGAKLAKTAEGAMKGAFTAQMAAGGEEAARAQVLSESGASAPRDLTWRERAEVGYHTLKEGITARFFGRIVGAWGKKIGNAVAAALEFGGINAAGVLADAYIGDNIAGREWKDEDGNILAGNEKDMAVLAKAGAAFAYGGMQSLLMSMGGGIAGRRSEGAEAGRGARPARPTEDLAAARQKAAAAMVQAAADPESAAVAARGANGETLMKNGALVRVAEDGATEIVTPDGVVLDAEGKVKTVTAGNVGETGEGSYGTAITVRMNPMTGRPTAARETVRNALVALQEGVTIDQLREIDGWTPENKAVFETVARLKQGLAEGMPAGELVDALASLGIGERDARAFGFIPEGNRYVGDALAVANNGTRSLQNAVGNGGPGHIPLDIAAEVARSVNAGTTGLMPKELAKRQLETARQLVAERAKAKLEESAAEHGNTPEAERAVLDTPVEKPDGSLTTLGEMAETAKTTETTETGNLPEVSEVPEVPAGIRPAPSGEPGVYVHGAVPEARVEAGAEIDMPDGTRVKGVLIKGLDPAEMLRPERRDAVADFLIEVIDGAQGRVAFENPEAEAAARELLKERVAREETQAQRQAEQEIVDAGQNLVDGLFGKESGIKVRRGTPEEAMEAAEGAVGKNAAVELLKDAAGEIRGYWDRAKKEVVLFGGASVETLGHEIAWHAVRQWAETHSPELLAKMNEYAKRCPEELRKLIEEAYKDFSGDALLDEIGAGRFENELGGRFRELLGRNAEARTWWEGVKATLKEMWQAFVKMIDGGGIDLRKLDKMDADEGMKWLVEQMLQGRRLEGGGAGVIGAEPGDKRLSLAGRRTDGIEVYESDPAVLKMPYRKRKKQFRDVMVRQYAGRTARFTRNGQTYYATFEEGDVRKNLYGDSKSDRSGWESKINAGASGDMFDLVENARYDHTSKETGKTIPSHRGVRSWDYFDKTVQIDNRVFDVVINVRDKGNDQFVYNVVLRRNRNIKSVNPVRSSTANPQSGTVLGVSATGLTPQSIPQSGGGAQAQIRPSIGGIYTGTAADYANRSRQGGKDDGPSLKKIGTGEGSQVYGWGLYGSNVRGVAEGYAKDAREYNAEKNGKRIDLIFPKNMLEAETAKRLMENDGDVRKTIEKLKRKGIGSAIIKELEEHGSEYSVGAKHEHLYEQTFFANRAPGDESRLLKWYEDLPKEQVDWIAQEFAKEGFFVASFSKLRGWTILDRTSGKKMSLWDKRESGEAYEAITKFLGSPQAASEFLYRAGIDGVKYPVDSYGGKTVKDGDKAGWNYVAFSDEHIRVDHKWTDGQLRFSRGGTGTGEKKKDVPTIGADMSEPGNAKAFRKYLSTRDAAPMPERLKDGRPRNVLQWFTENMVGKTFEFDIPGIGHREFRVKAGHLFRLVCDTPKGRSSSGKTIRKGFVGKAKDADEARRLIETGEVTTGDIAGWNEGRARSLPLIPEILESFDAVFREKARPGFLVFVKKFVSKSGHVNTVVMRLNEDGETLGPMSAHMKGITAEWLKGQDLAITDDGKVFTRQENSASSQVDSQDNAEGNSRANAESIPQDGADGNGDLRLSRGGYKPGDWRKTFTFGKAARGAAEQTNGGEAAGEERRRWEENPVDERIPEWDAPQRNPNIAKPIPLSAAEGVRLVKLLGGTMKKPKAYKDAIGVIDEGDERRIRDDLKAMGFFKGDDFLWAATATPAEVAADRADSQAALDARLEKLGEQRLKGEAGGGNRGLVRVSMSQVADLVLKLPAETGGNLGNVRTLAQGIVRGFEKDRTPGQQAYYLEEAKGLIDWFYGREGASGRPRPSDAGRPLQAKEMRQLLARAFGAWLEAPDAVAERAPGLYREFVDAISRNDKLLHAFDAIRRTALGEGSAERVYAEIEAGRTARAEEAARRLEDEVEKPIGSRLERAKDSFVYNFDDMHGPIFMHITRAQKRQLAELKASLKAGRITQADYDAATAAFRQAVQGLKIAELKVDRGTQNEIRQYLWDMSFVFEQAKAAGVDPKDAQRYMDLRWIVSTGGRAGARGMSARDAQIVLDNMKRNMGDEAFARLEGVSAQFHAVREKNILDDPRLAAMIGQDRVDFFKNNVHYVRTERTRATPEELAKMEADRAAFRRENKGDDDVTAAMLALIEKTGGRGGGIGNSTWGHALEGSVRDVKDRLAATWRNDTRLMAAMERNDFVIQMRDALLAAKAEGVHDLPGSRGVDYPQNARYGHIRYFEGGRQRVLVVPRVIADGYRQVSDAMTGWSAWGKIAHGVFIDWNLAYTLRNMTRNMASNEANIVGMRADNATIVGNALLPGAGRAASMAAYQVARHLPSAVFRHPLARAAFGEHVNAAYAGQAQRILELYLDPRKAVERRAAAEEARLRGVTGPAMELDADLELMRFMTKSGALIARWDEVHGAGRDADLFMQGRGLGPIYGDAGASAPKSLARKIGGVLSYPFRRNAQFNRDLELHAKITAALAIHEMQPGLTSEQVGIEVARRASIPHAERRGANSKMINYAWNMFFNTALKGGQRFVGNVVRNPRLAGKMAAQSLGPQLFWATMIAGGGLAAVIRNMFGGGDDAEEKARQAGLGWLLDYTQFMHDGAFAASPYLQRFYHWCPLGQVGGRYIGIALPRTDEEKMLLPFIDWAAAKIAPQPTDPTATLGDAVKRGVVGTFVPDIFARTPLVAAAQDLLGPILFNNNPMDTYRGTHVYDNSLFQARGESFADAAAFGWEMGKQVWNDLGGRTIVRPRRNEIEVAEGSGGTPPSFAERAWDFVLNDIPVLSGVLGGTLRMTLTKEQRLDQVEREVLAPIRAVKNRRSEELMKMMLESPVANNGSETPEIKDKLDAWAERYGWDEAERGNVFARAFNGYQAATAAGQELAAQKKEKNRRVRYNKMPSSEKKAVEAAGLREILAE